MSKKIVLESTHPNPFLQPFLRGGGTWEDVVLKTEGDQILVRNGGNDFEPCLILQNTFDDGSSGGTLYVEESNGPGILTALAGLVSKEKA